jgi:hemerythrin-like domain-containing protein
LLHPRLPTLDEPIAFLSACHRRIEARLESLERAATALRSGDASLTAEATETVRAVVEHLAQSGRRHQEDEERSFFPRLRQRAPHLAPLLDRLEREHREETPLTSELSQLAVALRERVDSEDVRRFERVVDALRAHFTPHIAVEESELLPAAAEAFSAEDLRTIAEEMRARRR